MYAPLFLAATLVLAVPAEAHAESTVRRPVPGPAGQPLASAQTSAMAISTADCEPGGPSSTDQVLAQQLSPSVSTDRMNGIDSYQMSCARRISSTAYSDGLPKRAAVIAVMTAMAESTLHNYTQAVDLDSLGLFQQRPSQGWGTSSQVTDPVYATNKFLSVMQADYPNGSWQTGDMGAICQTVQGSAYPAEYDYAENAATIVVNALWEELTSTNGGWFTRPSSSSWSGVRVGSDGRAYQSVYSGAGWHTYPIDGGLSGTPTLVYANGETDFFGLAPSGDLWQDRYVNSGWTGWYRDTGVTFKAGTGISAIYADGMYQVFGVGPSGTMYRSYYSGGWHSQSLGGNLTGTPGVTYVDGRYDVFALAPSGQLYQNINRTGTWEGWNPDGTVQYRVGTGVSALYADGMYRVYGVGPSGVLYQAYYASGWHSQDLGGNITGTPTATYLNGRYDVFALSLSGDLWQLNRPDGGTWGTWAPEAAAV